MKNEYPINNVSEITLGSSLKVITKTAAGAISIAGGAAVGATQAVAGALLIAKEGSLAHKLVTVDNRVLYRNSRQKSAAAVTSFIRGQEASKQKVEVQTDL